MQACTSPAPSDPTAPVPHPHTLHDTSTLDAKATHAARVTALYAGLHQPDGSQKFLCIWQACIYLHTWSVSHTPPPPYHWSCHSIRQSSMPVSTTQRAASNLPCVLRAVSCCTNTARSVASHTHASASGSWPPTSSECACSPFLGHSRAAR